MTIVLRSGCVESLYYKKSLLWRVYESSRLVWNMERRLEGYILKQCQEPYFNYRIQYGLQIWRAYRYGGAPYLKVVRSTEQQPHIQI